MGFLDSVKTLFGGGGERDKDAYWIYVRCRRCGEPLKTRINLSNDVSRREEGGFMVHKTLVGSQRCFERIEVTLVYDGNLQVVEREIARGDFITPQEFEAAGNS